MQSDPDQLRAIGAGGGGIGYEGVTRSLVVEFDTSKEGFDGNDNHIAIQSRGLGRNSRDHRTPNPPPLSTSAYSHQNLIATATNWQMNNGGLYEATITYVRSPQSFQVRLKNLSISPPNEISFTRNDINLEQWGIPASGAYVGFTAGSFSDCQRAVITSWSLTTSQLFATPSPTPQSGPTQPPPSTNPRKTVGLFNRANGSFLFNYDNTGNSAGGGFGFITDPTLYGDLNIVPVTGDWNGDGIDTVGYYDRRDFRNTRFVLTDSPTGSSIDYIFPFLEIANLIPIIGDWDGDGKDTVGGYHRETGQFHLTNSTTSSTIEPVFAYGPTDGTAITLGLQPVVGDWNYDGKDTVGLFGRYNINVDAREFRYTNLDGLGESIILEIPPPTGGLNPQANADIVPVGGAWVNSTANGATVTYYDRSSALWTIKSRNNSSPATTFTWGVGVTGGVPLAGRWDGLPLYCSWGGTPTTMTYQGKSNTSACTYVFDLAARKRAANFAFDWRNRACPLFCAFQYAPYVETSYLVPTATALSPLDAYRCGAPSSATDCANFLSQAYLYAGLPMTVNWACELVTAQGVAYKGLCLRSNKGSLVAWSGAEYNGMATYFNNGYLSNGAVSGLDGLGTGRYVQVSTSPVVYRAISDIESNPQSTMTAGEVSLVATYLQQVTPVPDATLFAATPTGTFIAPTLSTSQQSLWNVLSSSKFGLDVGDILFTDVPLTQHVVMIVGWGPAVRSWGELSRVQKSHISATPGANLVPYIVDHGIQGVYANNNPTNVFATQIGAARPYYALEWRAFTNDQSNYQAIDDWHLVALPDQITLPLGFVSVPEGTSMLPSQMSAVCPIQNVLYP